MLQQLIANGLIQGAEIALLAVGFNILYVSSGFFAFTYGACFACAAYSFMWGSGVLPIGVAAALATLVSVTVGVSLESGVYNRIRKRGQSSLVLMLVSIGIYVVFQNTISLTFGDATRIVGAWKGGMSHEWLGVRLTDSRILIAGVSCIGIVAAMFLLRCTSLGRNVRAVADDPILASILGVNVGETIAVAAGAGSALAGVGAVLVSADLGLTPIMGFQALLLGVVGAVAGGIGSVEGAALAGLALGVLQQLAVWKLPSQWQDAVVFAVLVVVLICRPQGILGRRLKRVVI